MTDKEYENDNTSNNSTSKRKLEKYQQEGKNQIQKLVERPKYAEILLEDIGGNTRRRRESIQVPRIIRSSSSRSRTLGDKKG